MDSVKVYLRNPILLVVNTILAEVGVQTANALYVGDSGVDMLTARHAGVESVGVTWGFRPVEELQQAGACHIGPQCGRVVALCGKW